MVLDQGLEKPVILLLQNVLCQHCLLRGTLWNLVLHEAPVVLLDNCNAVPARERLELRALLATDYQTGSIRAQGRTLLLVQGHLTHVYEFSKGVLHLVLENDDFA